MGGGVKVCGVTICGATITFGIETWGSSDLHELEPISESISNTKLEHWVHSALHEFIKLYHRTNPKRWRGFKSMLVILTDSILPLIGKAACLFLKPNRRTLHTRQVEQDRPNWGFNWVCSSWLAWAICILLESSWTWGLAHRRASVLLSAQAWTLARYSEWSFTTNQSLGSINWDEFSLIQPILSTRSSILAPHHIRRLFIWSNSIVSNKSRWLLVLTSQKKGYLLWS